jgi:hypothetical protein
LSNLPFVNCAIQLQSCDVIILINPNPKSQSWEMIGFSDVVNGKTLVKCVLLLNILLSKSQTWELIGFLDKW